MEWKETVIKFYSLKRHSLTFKGNLYDFTYISRKKSVGIITEILGENIFTIAFFPSMKNDKTFFSTVRFDMTIDFIIPRYESLVKFANYIVQKDFQLEKTVDLEDRKMLTPGKHLFHERLAELYKGYGENMSEYDMLLLFICRWLGIEEDVFK